MQSVTIIFLKKKRAPAECSNPSFITTPWKECGVYKSSITILIFYYSQ